MHPTLLSLLLWLLVGCDQPPEGPLNVVLVSMDTLRADRLGAYGNTSGITPNLDRFAAQAVVFEDAWAVANETLTSHAALFTSRYPTETGPLFDSYRLQAGAPTLAEVLGIYGYQSAAFNGGGHLTETFGLGRGFDLYRTSQAWGSLFHTVPEALSWLDGRQQEQPFFLFVHGYDTHHRYLKPGPYGFSQVDAPYEGPGAMAARGALGTLLAIDGFLFPRYRPADLLRFRSLRIRGPSERARVARLAHTPDTGARVLSDKDEAFIRGTYDGAAMYGDAFFGLLMAGLRSRGLLDNSLVVLVADHGEELGEHGLYHHRYTLSDESLRIPIIMRPPGGLDGGRSLPGLVDLTDVMPTLLDAAGAETPAGTRGSSLWPVLQGAELTPRRAVYSQCMFRSVSARDQHGRLSFTGMDADSPWLADLIAASRLNGPAFEASEGLSRPQQERLRQGLVAWARSLQQPDSSADPISEEQLRIMQEKGYWGAE